MWYNRMSWMHISSWQISFKWCLSPSRPKQRRRRKTSLKLLFNSSSQFWSMHFTHHQINQFIFQLILCFNHVIVLFHQNHIKFFKNTKKHFNNTKLKKVLHFVCNLCFCSLFLFFFVYTTQQIKLCCYLFSIHIDMRTDWHLRSVCSRNHCIDLQFCF